MAYEYGNSFLLTIALFLSINVLVALADSVDFKKLLPGKLGKANIMEEDYNVWGTNIFIRF